MHTLPLRLTAAAFGAVAALTLVASPSRGSAQTSEQPEVAEVVSKEIAVSRDEASLRLELADGEELEISFEDGRVEVDGEDLGASDDALEEAWRELLGRAVALDDGPLARALIDWEPVGSDAASEGLGSRLDAALERALQRRVVARDEEKSSVTGMATLVRLLGRSDRLGELAFALDDLDIDELAIHVDEDVTVEPDEELDGTLLVVDGDAEIRGSVDGHVVVVGGTLRTFDGSRIGGDVRLSNARLERDGGTIDGVVRELEGDAIDAQIEARLREAEERVQEAREEARAATERVRVVSTRDDGFWSPLRTIGRSVGRGVAGILQTAVAFLVLSVLGGLAVMLGRDNLEVVARTARRSPGRSAAVGLAGAFLSFPAWVLGIVALSITIIGIPVMIAWVPLFPLAVALAAVMGYFAVAMNAGEWLARKRYPYLDWIRSSNPYTLVVGGTVGLLAAFLFANVVTLFGPMLSFLRGLLVAAGVVMTVGASLVGFGAVLLTRAGRRPEYWGGAGGSDPFDDPWDWDPTPAPSQPTRPTGSSGAEEPSASPGTEPGGGTGTDAGASGQASESWGAENGGTGEAGGRREEQGDADL
ncbi:MAG: hypothetical protein PVI57_10350 [Gemmatimonadota bacterium]|jgi:hypothetical protein